MNVNCQDHRKSMELLGLKLRLKEGIADRQKRDEIKKRITVLQKELRLD